MEHFREDIFSVVTQNKLVKNRFSNNFTTIEKFSVKIGTAKIDTKTKQIRSSITAKYYKSFDYLPKYSSNLRRIF